MRSKALFTLLISALIGCSVLLTACDAITAQNIERTGAPGQGMNGFPGMNGGGGIDGGGQGMSRGGRMNGGGTNGRNGDGAEAMQGMMDADVTGRIVSIEGGTITVDLLEQEQTDATSNQGRQWNPADGNTGLKETGVEMKISVSDDVQISRGMTMGGPNNRSDSSDDMSLSDLKTGDVIRLWYKDNTETAARIVVQS
ncbi:MULTISPECIES: hypothetical protein [unclassified Paenibacillus]|uniref:hypothetical protein n=1 Tax=unclassified Paenibacillus TaxID=185978 RepID=UPI001F1A580E|nr:hypothetical protein [Paenibacillus sp. JJ-223]CAH1222100.1 hypothetical protein PAECIP111890_05348 [Paenibacillus sp. JJ-223]